MIKFDHEDCVSTVDLKDCSYTAMFGVSIPKNIVDRVEALVQETIQNVTDDKPSILR